VRIMVGNSIDLSACRVELLDAVPKEMFYPQPEVVR